MINPKLHKVLRDNWTYYTLLIFSFLLILGVAAALSPKLDMIEKRNSFASLCPITFLILYRQFDNYIIRKLKRHIYFRTQYSTLFVDEESKEATSIEYLFQMLLFIIPLLWMVVGNFIFR
jgi:hypothetical protein